MSDVLHERFFLNFQVKIAGFNAFYCGRLPVDRNLERGGFIYPMMAVDVKRSWFENLV